MFPVLAMFYPFWALNKAQLKNQGVFPHQVATTEPGEEDLIDFIQAIQAGGICKMEITSNEQAFAG